MKRLTSLAAPAIASAFLLAGCPAGNDGQYQEATQDQVDKANMDTAKEEAKGHVHSAPHGGHLIELGDHQYNLEVVFPDGDGNLSLHVLGAHAVEEVMVTAEDIEFEIDKEGGDEVEIEVTAVGGTDGKSSHFTAPASALGGVDDIEELHAHAHVTIEGTEFVGKLDHDHDEHDHDDDKEMPAGEGPGDDLGGEAGSID